MNLKTKELWVIPTIIALATGVLLGAGFMFLGLWLAGTPINASFSLEWIMVALSTSLPIWVTLAVLAVATTITGLYFRQRAKTKSAENWIAKLNKEPVPGKLTPKLHVSWRGLSGWCWAQHDGERVFRISGDGPILLEDTQEKAIITGVLIEGAEFVGVFDNFELSPGKPTFRGMNLDFKGINPVDKEPVTVKLTFVDLRGNKYPTNETTFKPLSLPNQSGGLPWPQ